MNDAAACTEAYPPALARGEVIECEKTIRHRKHSGHDTWIGEDGSLKTGTILWSGARLTPDERDEADRIRALGGVDREKGARWLADLMAGHEKGADDGER